MKTRIDESDESSDTTSLKRIVETRNTRALEAFCQGRTYQQVRDYARDVGVDLDELEELLGEI